MKRKIVALLLAAVMFFGVLGESSVFYAFAEDGPVSVSENQASDQTIETEPAQLEEENQEEAEEEPSSEPGDGDVSAPEIPDHEHVFVNGVCMICFAQEHIYHTFVDGVCTVCGAEQCVHTYKDGVCTKCGEPIVWDLYMDDEERMHEHLLYYARYNDGTVKKIEHGSQALKELAVIVIMLKTDQPDYRYDVAMNADGVHGGDNHFQHNDIFVHTTGQFNPDYDTLFFTLMLNEDHEIDLYDVSGGDAKIIRFSEYDEETGTYSNLSPAGNPQYGLEFVLNRRTPGEVPPIASTVDSGFKINLFNYHTGENGREDINELSDLKFYTGNEAEGTGEVSNEPKDDSVATQGIVEAQSGSDGYPSLTEFDGRSLDVLFDEKKTASKDVYTNVDGLFLDDGDGGLVFNSDTNYAFYDTTQGDGGDFTVYDGTYTQGRLTDTSKIDSNVPVGFFPFNAYDDTLNDTDANAADPLTHSYGMFVEGDIYIPESGKIDGEPLVFSFEGSDDAWLFIDDVLIMDVGGIHNTVKGTVDFSTGKVTVSDAVSIDDETHTVGMNSTLSEIFESVGKEWTLGGQHTFKFYSLQRGSGNSDLKLETNLNKVLDKEITDVTVEKRWVDENGNEVEPWLDEVTVQLYKTVDGKKVPVEGKALVLNKDNEWKGIFKSLPAMTEDHVEIDYSVEEETEDGVNVKYERGGKEVKSDIYWVKADLSEGMQPGVYAILGKDYDVDENGKQVTKNKLLTAQGEDKEVTYRDVYQYSDNVSITDPRDGKTYTSYIDPVYEDEIWTIAKVNPVQSKIRTQSANDFETVEGPDGTVYKVLSAYVPPYATMQIPANLVYGGYLPFIPNSNTEFYVVDDGYPNTTYYTYNSTFYKKTEDGQFVPMEDIGTVYMHAFLIEDGYYVYVDNNSGTKYYQKIDEYGYYRKDGDSYVKLTDEEQSSLGSLTRLMNFKTNDDGYVIWHTTGTTSGIPSDIYSDITLYNFYVLKDGEYVPTSSPMSGSYYMMQYTPIIVPEYDENGYLILHQSQYPYANEKLYYGKEDDGTIWEKDDKGNYTQVFPINGAGYAKMKTVETDGPVYDWIIGNQGLNLTLVGPGQQWFDYTYITSKKDGQGASNEATVGYGMAMGGGYLQQLYSDYNYRNVFRFENADSEYGDTLGQDPEHASYEGFGMRIFSFQDLWLFQGYLTPYEKNLTVNTSSYQTKESYDTAQAGRFWFYKPVPVPGTYDLSKNDWVLTNSPAGDLKITKETSDGSGKDTDFTFTIILKDSEGNIADNITGMYGEVEFVGGMATVVLKAGESAVAKNIPAGLNYEVTETVPDYYVLVSSEGSKGKIEGLKEAEAKFVNRMPVGDLTVTKTVEGKYADTNTVFTFTVAVEDTSVNGSYGDMKFASGVAKLTLKAGESATAKGLPAGVGYIITEETDSLGKGWSLASKEGSEGSIKDGETVKASFVNKYEKPTGSLKITKKAQGVNIPEDESFVFRILLNDKTVTGKYGDFIFRYGTGFASIKVGETAVAEGLPAGLKYKVEEGRKEKWLLRSAENAEGIIAEGKTLELTFLNEWEPPKTPDKDKDGKVTPMPSPKTGAYDPYMYIGIVLSISVLISYFIVFGKKKRTGR